MTNKNQNKQGPWGEAGAGLDEKILYQGSFHTPPRIQDNLYPERVLDEHTS
jgi:hypothetical protein